MAEVVTPGRGKRPWSIDLVCPRCDCVGRFTCVDVRTKGDYVHAHCPECDQKIEVRRSNCARCQGTGTYTERHNGWGVEDASTWFCPCRNFKDKPTLV